MNIDKVYYYNRNGVLKLTLNEPPYYAGDAEFKDWQWSYDNSYGVMSNFRRTKDSFPFQITIISKSKSDRDNLYEIFTEDVLAGRPGCLVINDWKLPCYITEAEHDFFGTTLDWQIKFNAVTETSTWTREKTTSFSGVMDEEENVDLGRDYTFESGDDGSARGYADASGSTVIELVNSFGENISDSDGDMIVSGKGGTSGANAYGYSAVSSRSQVISLLMDGNGYRVTFYGAAVNPEIYLDNKPVRVLTSINDGELLEVTSNGREKTIYKISAQGDRENVFQYRDKSHSPFFDIGKNTLLTYGEVKFDFTTIERRSEPSWT